MSPLQVLSIQRLVKLLATAWLASIFTWLPLTTAETDSEVEYYLPHHHKGQRGVSRPYHQPSRREHPGTATVEVAGENITLTGQPLSEAENAAPKTESSSGQNGGRPSSDTSTALGLERRDEWSASVEKLDIGVDRVRLGAGDEGRYCDNLKLMTVLDYTEEKLSRGKYPMDGVGTGKTRKMIDNFFATLRQQSPDLDTLALTSDENYDTCVKVASRWNVECVKMSSLHSPRMAQLQRVLQRFEQPRGAGSHPEAVLCEQCISGVGVKTFWQFYVHSYMEQSIRDGKGPVSVLLTDVDMSWWGDPKGWFTNVCRAGHDLVVNGEQCYWCFNSGMIYMHPTPLVQRLLDRMMDHVVQVATGWEELVRGEVRDLEPLLAKYGVRFEGVDNPVHEKARNFFFSLVFDQTLFMDVLRNIFTGETRMRYTWEGVRRQVVEAVLKPAGMLAEEEPALGVSKYQNLRNFEHVEFTESEVAALLPKDWLDDAERKRWELDNARTVLRQMPFVKFASFNNATLRDIARGVHTLMADDRLGSVLMANTSVYRDSNDYIKTTHGVESVDDMMQPRYPGSVVRHCISPFSEQACLYDPPVDPTAPPSASPPPPAPQQSSASPADPPNPDITAEVDAGSAEELTTPSADSADPAEVDASSADEPANPSSSSADLAPVDANAAEDPAQESAFKREPCGKLKVVTVLDYSKRALKQGKTQRMIDNYFATLHEQSPSLEVVAFTSDENHATCAEGAAKWRVECVGPRQLGGVRMDQLEEVLARFAAPRGYGQEPELPVCAGCREGCGMKTFWPFFVHSYMEQHLRDEGPLTVLLTDLDMSWWDRPLPYFSRACSEGSDLVVKEEQCAFCFNSGLILMHPSPLVWGLLGVMMDHTVAVSLDWWGVLARETADLVPLYEKYGVNYTYKEEKQWVDLTHNVQAGMFDQAVFDDAVRNMFTGETRMRYTYMGLRRQIAERILKPAGLTDEERPRDDNLEYAHMYNFEWKKLDPDVYDVPTAIGRIEITDFELENVLSLPWLLHANLSTSTIQTLAIGANKVGFEDRNLGVMTKVSLDVYQDSNDYIGKGSITFNDTNVPQWRKSIVRHCLSREYEELCLFSGPKETSEDQ